MSHRILTTRRIFNGKIINLRVDEVELPDGSRADREIVEHPGACVIVPVDSEGNVHLVRQYRHAACESLLELPAGKLNRGEEPLLCAQRELREELGLLAGSWLKLASFYSSPGFCNEILHAYLACELRVEEEETERERFVTGETMPLEPLENLLGEIRDAKSIAGILLAVRLNKKNG